MRSNASKARRRSARRIRYAVVGLGHIAQVAVLPAFRNAARNSDLVTLVSGDNKKLRATAARYGLTTTYDYDHYDQLLASGIVDAVYLTVPNHLHRSFVERTLKAGVHVLCEKPLGLTVRDCRAMVRTVTRSKAKLMVAYRLHFDPANLKMVDLIRTGRLGEVRIVHSLFTQDVRSGDTRLKADIGGGPLLDIGIYCINAARYLFQAEPTEVFAMSATSRDRRFREVDEMHGIVMRFPGERLATFLSSFGASNRAEFDIVGTLGSARLEASYKYSTDREARIIVGPNSQKIRYPQSDQFGPQLLYFSDCIIHNRTPEPSAIEGLIDVEIIDALHRSAKHGRTVVLPRLSRKRRRPSLRQLIHCPPIKPPNLVRTKSPTIS